MASRVGPRSVKDATRFTSTIPHAVSKSAGTSAAAGASKPASRIPGETPEQRVRRLRQAHLAAQQAQISQTDRVLGISRKVLDAAHRWTIGGVILFTAVAGVVSIYSVWDMLRFNRARRAEWVEAQKKFEADELATARLAYLKGSATEAQILLVEEANREAEEKGVKLPPLLSPPEHRTHFEETLQQQEQKGKGVLGVIGGLFGGSAKSEPTLAPSTTAPSMTSTSSSAPTTAWEMEKDNQRKGGSLDQLGLTPEADSEQPKRKGWFW